MSKVIIVINVASKLDSQPLLASTNRMLMNQNQFIFALYVIMNLILETISKLTYKTNMKKEQGLKLKVLGNQTSTLEEDP